MTWIAANTAIKISIRHLYLTLFGSNKTFRLFTFTVIGLVLLFCFGVLLATFLNCRPFAKTWNPLLPGSCGSLQANVLSTSIINFVIDLSIVLLPMPMVWSLQIARSRNTLLPSSLLWVYCKCGAIQAYIIRYLIWFGYRVCAITITRIILATRLNINDFTYDLAKLAIVTCLEPLLGIVVACAPFFPTIIKILLERAHKPTRSDAQINNLAISNRKMGRKIKLNSFDDNHPLSDLEGCLNETHITSPSGHWNRSLVEGVRSCSPVLL